MKRKGPWSKDEIDRYFRETRVPVRIACNGLSGHPVLVSLWFAPIGDKLWCATQRTASVVALLARDPRCAFEVSDESIPYRGVRGSALATLHDDRGEEVLRLLVQRYLPDPESRFARWLLGRAEHETTLAIEPLTLVSWDYQQRMVDT